MDGGEEVLHGQRYQSRMRNEKKELFVKTYPNAHFYTDTGLFDAETAKTAFYEMFSTINYPIVQQLHTENFWVTDFGLGKFTEIGMGGIFWLNLKEENYFAHEIYLLPGQSIPEHRHMATPNAAAKRESWHVRHGWVRLFAEGESTPGVEEWIPSTHQQCIQSKAMSRLMAGEVAHMGGPEQWHFMQAGDQGAVVTEYATYHDGDGLQFTHPKVAL